MGRGRPGSGVDALKTCIRVRFTWHGRRYTETLDLSPTPANLRAATRLADTIKREIAVDVFDYAKHFPESANVPVDTTSFAKYADMFLATVMGAHSTKVTYGVGARKWKAIFAGRDIASLKPTDISTAISTMSETLKGRSINAYMAVLRGIFELAVSDKLIEVSPTLRIKRMKVQRPDADPLTLAEMALVIEHLAKTAPQIALFYEFAFTTGLRPSEQIALRWGKIDWRQKTAKIDVAFVLGRDKPTKSNRVRHIDLVGRPIEVLKRMKAHTFMRGMDGHVFVRPSTGDPWLTNDDLREKYWHPALKAVGLRLRDAYQTRHTYATALLMGGIHPSYIAKQLGHADVATTLYHYARWLDAEDKGRQRDLASKALGQTSVTQKPKHMTSLDE